MGLRIHRVIGWGLPVEGRFDLGQITVRTMANELSQHAAAPADLSALIARELPEFTRPELSYKLLVGDLLRASKQTRLQELYRQHGELWVFVNHADLKACRCDDIIDYYDCGMWDQICYLCPAPQAVPSRIVEEGDDILPLVVKEHPSAIGVHPYGSHVRRCYSAEVRENVPEWIDAGWYNQQVGRWDPKLRAFSKDPGYLRGSYRPRIPEFVLVYVWYLRQLGLDLTTRIDEIRPMIYTYWS